MGIQRLLEKASAYINEADLGRIREAYDFAEQAHHGQVRKSGEPYILHPLAVAEIVVNMGMDVLSIIAALLHDVVEDTTVSLQEINDTFGSDCAMLVDGLTKLERIRFQSKEEQQNENYRKMFIAMAQDIRVIVIKLADRLHNMRTLKYKSEEGQRRIAYETLEIFCPIAGRLGISAIKWEMEDIALRYLNPQQYYRIANLMHKKRTEREEFIESVISRIAEKLDEMGIQADMSGRPKHIYSVYQKMSTKNKQFSEIYDLLAIRIIVDNIKDCYATLGIIHTLWKPMPGRFKDYIAMPKANMYQSLHTTVVGPNGEPTEVQIRTWEMHKTAEFGIAAHWAYKEGSETTGQANKMPFFKEILELQHEAKDASEFVESLKMDFFTDLVFVFTPQGEVIELPAGSVPLDFAYRIHTEVGNRTIGAKVNGRIVPLDHKLKTGDIVEILTSKHSYGPSQDWLKIAQSSHARSKIKQWFKKEKREENVEKGRDAIERELRRAGYETTQWMTDDKLLEVAKKFNFNDLEDMLSAIGFGGITAAQVVTRMTERYRKEQEEAGQRIDLSSEVREVKAPSPEQHKSRPTNGVRVKGIDNLLVRFARCCNPVPGDDIIGYITRGRGVSVHRSDCANIPTGDDGEDAARVIEVEWEDAIEANYSVDIEITGHDRRGLLNEVLQAVSESKTNISAVSGRSDKNKMAMIHMTILIRNIDHLQSVVEKIKRVQDVYTVHRIMQ